MYSDNVTMHIKVKRIVEFPLRGNPNILIQVKVMVDDYMPVGEVVDTAWNEMRMNNLHFLADRSRAIGPY